MPIRHTDNPESLADPIFLSILQGKQVSIAIDAHPLLEIYLHIDKPTFRAGGHIWQCVLTTQGTFNAKVYHRSTGELLTDMPQHHTMTWFLDYPANKRVKNEPLY